MAIKKTSTGKTSKFKKILVYGKSGSWKTRTCLTAVKPLIISSENKLESLSDEKIPVWSISTMDDFEQAIEDVLGKKGRKYQTVCIDSLSDIAETAVSREKENQADPRKAYLVIQDLMFPLLRKIRDSDSIHFYIITKVKMIKDDNNVEQYVPRMPGRQMGPELPYLFDYVFPMRLWEDDEDNVYPYLQCNEQHDTKWIAKDSSGRLKKMEEPNLEKLFKKLNKKKKG